MYLHIICQVSSAVWCCSYTDGEGFWYTEKYPEEMFFYHWFEMASRYVQNPMVIGADLRNELRGYINPVTNETTPVTWGFGSSETDWKLAAEEAGRTVLDANPNMLVIVEGIVSGGDLTAAVTAPVLLPIQERLVYSGHMYTTTPVISDMPWPLFEETMFLIQTFVKVPGHEYSAAFWFGENYMIFY